ncbi:MAG: Sir2 family NAD-dependent protein deacetylase [Leptospirales bacterium]
MNKFISSLEVLKKAITGNFLAKPECWFQRAGFLVSCLSTPGGEFQTYLKKTIAQFTLRTNIVKMVASIDNAIERAAKAIEDSGALVITAGAGIGVDSGLPDFRGNEGFWKAYPPIAKLGISFSEMANPSWFKSDPGLAWAFYGHRLNLYRKTTPHKGFDQLLEMAQEKQSQYFIFTSNVDGQFQKAGFSDARIEECHGSIHHFQCTENCSDDIWGAKNTNIRIDEGAFKALEPLPVCTSCGALARPNILMFSDWEWIPQRSLNQAEHLDTWLANLQSQNTTIAIIELGAGSSIPTVRRRSEQLATRTRAQLIRINPRDYQVPQSHISVPLAASEGIDRIYRKIKENRSASR